jgi:hypothetical protein
MTGIKDPRDQPDDHKRDDAKDNQPFAQFK